MTLLRWTLDQIGAYRTRVGALFGLSCVEVVLRVLLPWPMMAIVDQALGSSPQSGWLLALPGVQPGHREGLLVALVALGFVIQVAHQMVLLSHTRVHARTGHLITRDLRQRLFMHLQGLNLRHHTRTPIGDSGYRLQQDVLCLERLLLRGARPLTCSALTLVVMSGAPRTPRRGERAVSRARLSVPRGRRGRSLTPCGSSCSAIR